MRVYGTTRAIPRERFERQERAVLQALANHPYHSLTLRAPAARDRRSTTRAAHTQAPSLPRIDVEQQPLHAYAALAGGAR